MKKMAKEAGVGLIPSLQLDFRPQQHVPSLFRPQEAQIATAYPSLLTSQPPRKLGSRFLNKSRKRGSSGLRQGIGHSSPVNHLILGRPRNTSDPPRCTLQGVYDPCDRPHRVARQGCHTRYVSWCLYCRGALSTARTGPVTRQKGLTLPSPPVLLRAILNGGSVEETANRARLFRLPKIPPPSTGTCEDLHGRLPSTLSDSAVRLMPSLRIVSGWPAEQVGYCCWK
ncbi:hypothetical protein BKA70DRAFT_749851 [Coprinopsis sp. MPI-PUGE-AT-0042]|nr:hypothetical protein BKA70DRAFT_749851 [Coprinopsis sp. MPI-PUGE-AT-0042]